MEESKTTYVAHISYADNLLSDDWEETYSIDEMKRIVGRDEANFSNEEVGKAIIKMVDRFNKSLKKGERKRELLSLKKVEVTTKTNLII